MIIRDVCPRCKSPKYKKNGHIHNGKQNHHCHDCGRQFVQCCEQYLISEEKRGLIERLLVERISLRGICRAVGVTLKWLLGFLVQCFEALPDHLHVQPLSCTHDVLIQRLEVEADELASFVQKKANKQWVWIAMDAKTRQIIAFHVGDRSHTSAEHLWAKIPTHTVSMPHFTRINMWCMQRSFLRRNTGRSASWRGKPITSSASTTRYASACHGWSALRCPFPRSSPTISGPLSFSFVTTT